MTSAKDPEDFPIFARHSLNQVSGRANKKWQAESPPKNPEEKICAEVGNVHRDDDNRSGHAHTADKSAIKERRKNVLANSTHKTHPHFRTADNCF